MLNCMRNCRPALRRVLYALLLALCLQPAYAQVKAPSLQAPVTVSGKNISLLEVFQAIKKQTGFTLVYNNQLLDDAQKISINFKKAQLQEVLDYVLKDRNIRFDVKSNRIVLDKKDAPLPAPTQTTPAVAATSETVKGQVMDVKGNPLPGVTVTVAGTSRGAVTDELGIFSITASKGEVLNLAMMGMNPEQVVVSNARTLKISLSEKVDDLSEVVIVGFGAQKKVTVTGSVATVNMQDMQTPVRSLSNALAGKVAGVISMQTAGGEPGYDNPQFTIRGVGTFTGSASPLIVVDGVQRDDVNSSFGGAFNNIDAEDIASISLLKDASATAIFGAKGANGVLIITTKKGVAGKPKISAKVESGVTGLTKLPKMLDGVSYMQLLNEARANDGLPVAYSDELIAKTASGLDPYLYPNVNWIDAIYKDWASMTNANVNISGGGEAMRYYVSMSFYDQEGQYKVDKDVNNYNPNLNFKRYDFRSNIDLNITKTTLLSLNLAAMLVNSRYPGHSGPSIWYNAFATNPVAFPISYGNNQWAGPRNNGGNNPFNMVQNAGYATEFKPSVQSILSLNQRLDHVLKGLSATGRFSFDSYAEFNNRRSGPNDLWFAGSRDTEGGLILERVRNGATYLDYSSSSLGERVMYLEGNINYDRAFGEHTVGALLVGSMRNRLRGSTSDLKSAIPYRNQSTAARFTYNYKDKYLAEVNVGATGSENFEKGNRWGYFPAMSAGWVISKEDFFKYLSSTISLLKVRASWGVTGNDQISDQRFGYLTYIGGGNGAWFGYSPLAVPGVSESVLGTQNLTWEKSNKTNFGLELGLWGKINVVADIFQDQRSGILINRNSISPIAGYNGLAVFANMGEMRNRGIDGSIEYNDRYGKDWTLRLFGNVTYAKNKILYADYPKLLFEYQQFEGTQFQEFFGYKAIGLFTDQGDIDKSPDQLRPVKPGDIKYADLNNDNIINTNDQTYLGKSRFPLWSYGYGINLGWRRFDLSALFSGVADVGIMANGNDINMNDGTAAGVGIVPFTGIGQYPAAMLSNVKSRWTEDNPSQNVDYPRLTQTNTTDNNYVNSTWWLKDGSFMRLKQASIGYMIVTPQMKKKGITSLHLYAAGTNLLTFSKFKLWDPELGNVGARYPYSKTVTVGLRAQF
ncbi:TonB-dependent receptor [Chitinophaga horti]|uniref:TonB-dependent receptor n=1 Tax=Chitinophaga horti TaxID=2920382 RepID=A0ABY6IXK0_9BACT|nr:TonB-dependent receptor [Chitinophaga horti]UYQ92120.1 TonB-dependent receptor [Chitinophaga horti]